jgi:cytochrome P450
VFQSTENLTLDASDPRFYAEENRPAYLKIHAADPVYHVDAQHSQPFWNVCNHELIREVGKQAELFTTTLGVHLTNAAFAGGSDDGPSLTPANMMDATDHRRVRGPLNPHFRHDEIGKMESDVRSMVRDVLDDIRPGEELDFMRAFAARVPLLVTAKLLGVSVEREKDFARWADTILTSFEPGAVPDWEALGEMVAFFGGEIAARRAEPGDGLISAMLESRLDDQDTLMWCWLLLAAGIETTGNLLGGGMDLLLRHPDQMARLADDPSMVRPAVSEMLRVVTPGRYIRRTATADTELGGNAIKAGAAVVMNFTVANYDPGMFEDPLRFDIERRPNEALAFSYGPHRCIGMSVARLASTTAFEELLARFPGTERRGDAVFRPSLATAVVESLPVVFSG